MKHLEPKEAYEFLQANPEAVFIDVRSEMEHMFVGHPRGSILIPWVDGPDWEIDPHFVAHVRKAASVNRPVVLICRSGRRSADAGLALEELPRNYASETALRYRFADDGAGELGLVAPVSEPFCGKCSRIRLTADGKIRTCLFSRVDHDLRGLLRAGAPDSEIAAEVERIVAMKEDGHHINDSDFAPPSRTMVFIGG